MKPKLSLLAAFLLLFIASCRKADVQSSENSTSPLEEKKPNNGKVENDMVLYWNEKAVTVIQGPFTPPAQARHLAMIHIAMHDALNTIKTKYQRFAMTGTKVKDADADAAVAAAAYWTLKGMNVNGSHPVDTWYTESLATIPESAEKELGKTLGQASANAIRGIL